MSDAHADAGDPAGTARADIDAHDPAGTPRGDIDAHDPGGTPRGDIEAHDPGGTPRGDIEAHDPAESPHPAAEPARSAAAEVTERPHPLTPLVRGWIVLLAVVLSAGRDYLPLGHETRPLPPLQFILLAVGVVALISGAAGFFSWRFTRFVVSPDVLRIDSGVIVRRSQRVSFDKVQSIDVVQPFAARLFGLAELQIDVGSHERPRLRYLARTRAYALRDYLLARARGVQAEAEQHTDAASLLLDLSTQDEVLITVPPQQLLLAAVTSHEFWAIVASGVLAAAAGIAFQQPWLVLVIAIPTASTLIGFVGRRVTSQFNYALSRRPHGLRISRGLTSLTSQSLPPRRVQAVQISQSPVWRALGLYRVDLEVVGWGHVTEDENRSGVSTILLPAGTIAQVRVALDAIWPRADFEAVDLHGAPARARWLHPLSQPFLRWGHDDRLVVSRHGWLVRRWQVVPHARVQSVRIAQGPVSRRLALADLEFHTAGAQISAHAAGLDASDVLARQAELLRLVHHPASIDLTEPPDTGDPAGSASGDQLGGAGTVPDQATAGPDARRADQADETISSTE
ncbi:PH domain-containing protein [Propionicimonas sp.]|uniref:PH domain-containing protein n=1 Tax=Propionicimonas sp. TaxID=1955623 RepID=UPI0039E48554